MAWFRKEKKVREPRREKHEIPPDAWEKCERCDHTDIREKFVRNLNVCPNCEHHRRIRAIEYVNLLLDEGTTEETETEIHSTDPLGFPEYPQRLGKATAKSGEGDAIMTFTGQLAGLPVCLGVMDFAFMGGSMGSVVGEKIARLGQKALERKFAFILVSASGGARMQEGVLSLMQMAKAAAILSQLAERRIPYVSILTNPTTGGVSASYAMLGDAILAEPGAVIGFAGPRVIKQTIGQDLPEGFQTSEFLLEHGMVDAVVHRRDLKQTVGQLLRHMSGKPAASGVDRGLSEYERTLAALFARTGTTSKFGLERTEAFLALLGNPHKQLRTIHVAGTNGKGSVVANLYTLLRAKGLSIGRYTSPHLVDFRERIVVDEVEIGEDEVVAFLSRWETDAEHLGATFFEITTALAFHHFVTREVDVAIIETGLGGRLDSTNVITPLVAGVTSIAVDHAEFLGGTIEEIAAEKGGIFKDRVPAVFGPIPDEARVVIERAARNANASAIIAAVELFTPRNIMVSLAGTEFDIVSDGVVTRLRSGLAGAEQAANSCIALAMLGAAGPSYAVTAAEAAATLPLVSLPGRFQSIGKLIFDVAHNPASMEALVRTLRAVDPERPLVAVLGILKDKDWRAMMETLAGITDHIILTEPRSAPASRSWDVKEARAYARSRNWNASLERDLDAAIRRSMTMGMTVVVTGSFHTVGDGLKSIDQVVFPPL